MFACDIIVNFFTWFEYADRNIPIKDPKRISLNYLKTWFWIDLISCLPVDYIRLGIESALGIVADRTSSIYKLNSLLKLFRLFKVMHAAKFLTTYTDKLNLNDSMIRLGKATGTVSYFIHLFACLWFFTARIHLFSRDTWVARYGWTDSSYFQ